jgi:hypothetical protein
MGCDYYIDKVLDIYYNDTEFYSIRLERTRGYYFDMYDEDDEFYEEKMKKYIEETLISQTKPITIYQNNSFTNEKVEIKYKALVEKYINDYGKTLSDIVKILKVEVRQDR